MSAESQKPPAGLELGAVTGSEVLNASDWGRIRNALRSEINLTISARRDPSNNYWSDYMAASKKRESALRSTLEKVKRCGLPNTRISDTHEK